MRRSLSAGCLAAFSCVLLALALPAPARGGPPISVLVQGGDALPGGGTATAFFFPTAVNARGEAVFGAGIAGDDGRFLGEGTYLLGRDGLLNLARPGATAPGGGTFSTVGIETMDVSDAGAASFTFALEPWQEVPFGANAGVFRYSGGTVSAVALPGDERVGAAGTAINDRGDLVYTAIIRTAAGPAPGSGLGMGLFAADRHGETVPLVRPGDAAPGGGIFDMAEFPRINDAGDLAFMGHERGDPCELIDDSACLLTGSYLLRGTTGRIEAIAAQGDPAPGGDTLRIAAGPRINDRGDVAYVAYWGPGDFLPANNALFLYARGATIPLVMTGDPMPGGGRVIRVRGAPPFTGINDAGQIGFAAEVRLDDGSAQRRLYRWSRGKLELLARRGTEVPGAGTIRSVHFGGQIDARGRVLFSAFDTERRPLLLLAGSTADADGT